MMKLEVHTLRFGDAPWLIECSETLTKWCKTHGYELIVWGNDPKLKTPKLIQKQMLDFFIKGGSDYMLYVDADVFVHPDAPAFPAPTGFTVATDRWHKHHNDYFREWATKNYGDNPKYGSWEYSNAGVWATDKMSARSFLNTMRKTKFIECFQEQHWFNVCVIESVVTVNRMNSVWNRYCKDWEPSYFLHLWGENKMESLALCKRLGLTTQKPNPELIHSVAAPNPSQDEKVIELEFVSNCGLGNQMFEWAAAYSISRSLNLAFRWTWKPSDLREFELGVFGFGENPMRNEPLIMERLGQGSRRLVEIAKKRITEHEIPVCRISCPFQAEECFIDHADDIEQMFELPEMKLGIPEGCTPVGVQVRRGDYLKHGKLNVTTPEYFTNAMRWISERVENPHFFVVSDDPKWCHSFFGYRDDVTVMPPQKLAEGIQTLASCHHCIISNSTFGWWGAWLGERRYKGHVVTPEVWHHGGTSYGQWEPIPKRWNRVSIKPPRINPNVVVIPKVMNTDKKAIVYPWKADGERWHELRYSLRSVDRFFQDRDCPIYILGTCKPGWLIEGGRVKYIGAYTYAEALSKGIALAEQVLWMNDDITLLKDTTWEDCEKTLYLKDVPPEFLARDAPQGNTWREGVVRMLRELAKEGITEQKVFSTHTPYVFRRVLALEILRKYGVWEKFPMELAYFHHHHANLTRLTTERATGTPFGDAQFLNYADKTLTAGLKEAVKALLPETPKWEMVLSYGV